MSAGRAGDGPPDAGSPVAGAESRALRDVIYEQLRDEILSGQVSPRERLTEPKLSKVFAVSRTPVREALARLLADGIVERTDYGYAVVAPSLADLRDLYELRVTLELRGIARAIENPEVRHDHVLLREELQRWLPLRDHPPEPAAAFVMLDEQFHITLSRASGNAQLTAALVGVNQKLRVVRRHDYVEAERVTTTVAEHIEILELVLEHRLDEALRALHRHVGESLEVVMQRATVAMTRMTLAS
ncbi:GntR family transcriptional regulator [Cellulomonas chengniuliangii]|uniref:GntR family transcriptional regulator n=1 Tax=Cellulomonas chengniuliangii TaxID=2968084 RepID=A0ABY5KZG4_9CELL|nr:GntR family transcriptional regulator [Cellulomonas chengniuliangii]MCC2307297.1 GntR family transcriptional regulator [Cellulomonas chengniuliangii]UUI75912.1 GntR family transcriptional regulator [Cellulomonas chengniuliangii]